MTSSLAPTLFLVAGRTLAFATTLFIPVVLARALSLADFGAYKQLTLLYATLYTVAQFGMAESLYYFVPRAPRKGAQYVSSAALFLAAAGAIALAALAGARASIAAALGNGALAEPLILLGLFLLLMLPSAVLEIAMIARGHYRLASVCYGVSDTLRAVFFLVPVIAFAGGVRGLLLGAVVFAAVRLSGTLVYVGRGFTTAGRPTGGDLVRQLRYAVPFGLAGLLEIFQATFHQYAVSYRFDAATFAIYAVGCFQIPLVDFIATSAGNVLMVQMRQDVRAEPGRAAWRRTVRELALMLVPLVTLLLVIAPDLVVSLFTATYRASVPIFTIWSIGILLAVLPTDAVLRVHAETRFIFLLNALRVALLLAALPWALSTLGLTGAVIVTLAAGAVAKIVALLKLRRILASDIRTLLPWRTLGPITAAAAVAATTAAVTSAALDIGPLARLLATSAVHAITYLAGLAAFRVFTVEEHHTLAAWWRRGTSVAATLGCEWQRTAPVVRRTRIENP